MFTHNNVLSAYGLDADTCKVEEFGTGLINSTWKVTRGDEAFIFQEINSFVFKSPADIAANLNNLRAYLKATAPDYLFVAPLNTVNGAAYFQMDDKYFRLFPFVKGSHTLTVVNKPIQAFEAAKQFGKFTALLNGFDCSKLKFTLPDFHNLNLRYRQFKETCTNATAGRMQLASNAINEVNNYINIITIYNNLLSSNKIPLRVIHHDTKISNVLFDAEGKGLCVIDLDTVMPGYFISDVGDMLRTYLSPVNEEEQDFDKIIIRADVFEAIYNGYMSEIKAYLTPDEQSHFIFAGKYMMYMQAMRFLTDFLQNDCYYHTEYPLHNLIRAGNQLNMLSKFVHIEAELKLLIKNKFL